jgi:hypothetical protein
MENYRLKVKIGDAEFDAEGPHDVVQAQFQEFQEMVANMPLRAVANMPLFGPTNPSEKPVEAPNGALGQNAGPKMDPGVIDASLSKIMKVESRVVSLTVTPQSIDDAALLLLYGQRLMRNNEAATGSEIVDGLVATGGLDTGRSDRMFDRIARNGDIIMIGAHRSKRYRLTNAGMNKARQIASGLIALVA